MTNSSRFSNEFNRNAGAEIIERGYPVRESCNRLNAPPHICLEWRSPAEMFPAADRIHIHLLSKQLCTIDLKDYTMSDAVAFMTGAKQPPEQDAG